LIPLASSRDLLGERMKEQYEDRTRYFLPRRTYTIIRVDGKAFHSYTARFERPFDNALILAMDRTAIVLCESLQGAKIGYVQSDEISIILTDFDAVGTEALFNGNLQKIVSVAASTATVAFNEAIGLDAPPTATFDARAFTIPDREEVMNYLVWRQKDASRNSIQAVAQSFYSPAELHGKNNASLHQMIFDKGTNWDSYVPRLKRGAAIIKMSLPSGCVVPAGNSNWVADANTPIFTQNRTYLQTRIPEPGYEKPIEGPTLGTHPGRYV
jgi:tRNA(His) guanylyltransferase